MSFQTIFSFLYCIVQTINECPIEIVNECLN